MQATDVRRAAAGGRTSARKGVGGRCARSTKPVSNAAFATWDRVYWQDNVRTKDRALDPRPPPQMQQSHDRFVDIFGAPPAHARRGRLADERPRVRADRRVGHALARLTAGGHSPYLPVLSTARRASHVQMPTTLAHARRSARRERRGRTQLWPRSCVTAHGNQSARSGLHAVRGTRGTKARADLRTVAETAGARKAIVCDHGRLLRGAGPRRAAIVPCYVGRNSRALWRADRPAVTWSVGTLPVDAAFVAIRLLSD